MMFTLCLIPVEKVPTCTSFPLGHLDKFKEFYDALLHLVLFDPVEFPEELEVLLRG